MFGEPKGGKTLTLIIKLHKSLHNQVLFTTNVSFIDTIKHYTAFMLVSFVSSYLGRWSGKIENGRARSSKGPSGFVIY